MLAEVAKSGKIASDTEQIDAYFEELCKKGILRSIAQNLTTVWYKTFEPLTEHSCASCGMSVCISADADKTCPNPACNAAI